MMIRTLATLALPSALLLGAISAPAQAFSLIPLSTFDETQAFNEGAAEIATFAPLANRLYVTNADANTIDILDISDPTAPSLFGTIDIDAVAAEYALDLGGVNSVAFNSFGNVGYIAAAVEADSAQAPGSVVFFDLDGLYQNAVKVGALPDMLTFTPDGQQLLVANEGEPNDDYSVDPEGSLSLIDVSGGISGLTDADVRFADFNDFDAQKDALIAAGVRLYGPNASVSQDLEPEYIAVSSDGTQAYVSLQENNALGILNLQTDEFEAIVPLGNKDHSQPGNALDASDEDGINIQTLPLFGIFQPDAIATFESGNQTYIVTANEGDARDYDTFSEETDLEELLEDSLLDLNNDGIPDDETTPVPGTGQTVGDLLAEDQLGEIDLTSASGDIDGDGLIEQLTAFGARSFSIWDQDGKLVFDSGDNFEQIISTLIDQGELPAAAFNTDNDENDFDSRSDAKGPEPEGVTIGQIGDRIYAFIGLERIGGVMVYDVTDPQNPTFATYTNNRDFLVDFDETNFQAAGDLGPEGLLFINVDDSPNGAPLLAVTNEVSGTTTLYSVDPGEASASVPEPSAILGILTGMLGLFGLKRR